MDEPEPARGGWPSPRAARAALTFLTRLPVGGFPIAPATWRWCSAWFPAVGALIGAISAATFALARPAGDGAAAALALCVSLFVTGAFHEDGLADTADALGGAPPGDRERLFAILKDSRIGTFGAAALVMSLVLRTLLLARLGALAPAALVTSHALARLPPVFMMLALPYVTPDGVARGKPVATAGVAQVAFATVTTLAILLAAWRLSPLSPRGIALAPLVCAALAVVAALRFRARAGGLTGDFLGATEQLGEVATLLVLAWA